MVKLSLSALSASLLLGSVLAHPGHDGTTEMKQRSEYLASVEHRSLAHCASKLKARGHEAKNIARRKEILANLRKKRALKKRDFDEVLNTDHHSTLDVGPETPDDTLFAGNTSCLLSPEVTEGPYYVSGELVRSDITEEEPGVPLTVDIQIVDTTTCEPLQGVYLDFWHCNSTGVYGGVIANGNGNSEDATNINNTALRGIQESNENGVVTFDTVFPGHYTGRTIHVHVLAHLNAILNPNNTISGGTIPHVGQIYFDQTLISAVEQYAPYNTNTQPLTTNANDRIMRQGSAVGDPVVEYVYVGDTAEEGIFSWISFGIDPATARNVTAGAWIDANGGHANPNGLTPPTGTLVPPGPTSTSS